MEVLYRSFQACYVGKFLTYSFVVNLNDVKLESLIHIYWKLWSRKWQNFV